MLRIAVCDDMQNDRDIVKETLTTIEVRWNVDFETTYFESGEDLCEDIKNNNYDLVLLDVIMCGIDGIETANQIRFLNDDSLIIFITSYDARIKEMFGDRIIGFIDKPVDIEKLAERIKEANSIISKRIDNEELFSYNKKGVNYSIPMNQIIYIESKNHNVILHTKKGDVTIYDTLKNIWNELKLNVNFAYPHKSYVINFKYVIMKKLKVEIITNNKTFAIGRAFKDDTIKRFTAYMEERSKL